MTGTDRPITPLRRVLDQEGRRYSWLAAQIGVDTAQMTRYLNGMYVPEDRRKAIADVLGRDVAELFPEVRAA